MPLARHERVQAVDAAPRISPMKRLLLLVLLTLPVTGCSGSQSETAPTNSLPAAAQSSPVSPSPSQPPGGSPAQIVKIACTEFSAALKQHDPQGMAKAAGDAEAAGGQWKSLGHRIVAAAASNDVAAEIRAWLPLTEACNRAGYLKQ